MSYKMTPRQWSAWKKECEIIGTERVAYNAREMDGLCKRGKRCFGPKCRGRMRSPGQFREVPSDLGSKVHEFCKECRR